MNYNLGYYKVNQFKYLNKIDAILEASKLNSNVKWIFNDHIFDNLNWLEEPSTDLDTLYYLRARQIREQYDYVLIMISGGADSTNVLNSFLKNNIKVDEIVAAGPWTGLKNWNFDINDRSSFNTVSETVYALDPLIKKISNQYPNIKITKHDYFEDIVNFKSDEWIKHSGSWIHPSTIKHSLNKFKHIKNLAESGKKIAKVYGIDKPVLVRGVNGNLYNVVLDGVIQVAARQSTNENHLNIVPELFYISPDMPEIMIKQSHVLARWLLSDSSAKSKYARKTMADQSFDSKWLNHKDRASLHHRAIIPALYNSLDDNIWQCQKSTDGLYNIDFDKWIHVLHKSEKFSQMILSDGKHLINSISSKFLHENRNAFKYFKKHWFIGHENKFLPQIKDNSSSSIPVSIVESYY
jgi:hypothetical protein